MPSVCEDNNCYDLFTGLNKDHLSKMMYEVLGPSSDYEKEKVNSYTFVPGSEKINMPINGPWRHKSIKDFLKHFDEGKFEAGILISLKMILGIYIFCSSQFDLVNWKLLLPQLANHLTHISLNFFDYTVYSTFLHLSKF